MATRKTTKRPHRPVVRTPAADAEAELLAITPVNSHVTDSVAQANTEVIGVSPAMAASNMFQGSAQALGLAALNATQAQQQNNISAQASSTVGLTTLYTVDTATDTVGTSAILSGSLKK